jgi:acetyl/propionyl-CoA carboxylase alpha subunit
MDYFVHVEGQRRHVRIDGAGIEVDGVPFVAELAPPLEGPGSAARTLRLPDRSVRLLTRAREGACWALELEGHRWTVEVLDRGQEAARKARSASGRPPGPAQLRAPMPGLVVRIEVQPGDVVEAGKGVMIVEAMKMENELRAPAPARVRAVCVQAGAAVEKDAVLLEFEPLDAGAEAAT